MRPPRQLKDADLANQIEKLLSKNPKTTMTSRQVSNKINVANPPGAILEVLKKLVADGKVFRQGVDHYQWAKGHFHPKSSASINSVEKGKSRPNREFTPNTGQIIKGTIDMTRSGDGYLVPSNDQNFDDDIFIPGKYLKGALNKDTVKVAVYTLPTRKRPEGKVVEIITRSLTRLIGTIRQYPHISIFTPDDNRFIKEINIHQEHINAAQDGDRVVVEIVEWGKSARSTIRGKVISVLENLSDHEMKMQGILLSNGFDIEFPPEVMQEVDNISMAITNEEIALRRDCRDVFTITIDPLTAKDFDDAISYRCIDNDLTEIGVHIADVTHYLREGTALDKEAFRRSTSVYLVDRVCPMLPHKLSNDLCSLNPHEDKYTFSAIFTFDKSKNIVEEWFGKTIIHSARRFTYEEAQERIETGQGDYAKEIAILNTFALDLRAKRYNEGSISFESDEVQFVLDENFQPVSLYVRERKAAHMLIEDFMLLANRKVAAYIYNKTKPEIPLVYRIHDLPNPDKLADFALFARELGFHFKFDTAQQIADSFNRLSIASEGNQALRMLEPLAIRTMAKAVYSTNNIGHYGLGFEYYSHFTSPIRRYADVMVHRTLFQNLTSTINREDPIMMEEKAKHISMMERKANDAERESIKYMQSLYISRYVGQEFDGIISGMIDRGVFVELVESKVEGFVPFDSTGEIFVLSSSKLKAKSRVSGDEYKMGQPVRVRIVSVDIENSRTEMVIL